MAYSFVVFLLLFRLDNFEHYNADSGSHMISPHQSLFLLIVLVTFACLMTSLFKKKNKNMLSCAVNEVSILIA